MRERMRRQEGSVLFVAVLLLALMGAVGIAALDSASQDRTAAGFYNRSASSFYAAEAGIAAARSVIETTVGARTDTPAFADVNNPVQIGDVVTYDREGGNLPIYFGDPAVLPNPPIMYTGEAGGVAAGGNLQSKGAKFTYTLWQINVVGQSPDGSSTRLEVMATKELSAGY